MPPDGFEPRRSFYCSCSTSSISTWYAPVFPICLTLHLTHNAGLNFSFRENENQMLPWRLPVVISKWQKQLFTDLKPENVLLDKDGYIKLCDFELAKWLGWTNDITCTFCGTTEYLAPETWNPLFQLHIEYRFNTHNWVYSKRNKQVAD